MLHPYGNRVLPALVLLLVWLLAGGASARAQDDHRVEESDSRFSDEPIPLADIPKRPRPILELGEPFLGTGTLGQGIRLPTGAVWQPALMAFGTIRTAAQGTTSEVSDSRLVEAAGRFDLFGNLYLTQTERVVIGFRPLDQDGSFTRFTLHSDPDVDEQFEDELNFAIRTLFFEGDLGELFPNLDRRDRRSFDIGISVGRQPLSLQDGLLMNEDAIDLLGLTRANFKMFGSVNTRVTLLFGWGDVDRPLDFGNAGDGAASLFGLSVESDTRKRTVALDLLYVDSDSTRGDGVYAGLSSVRRIGRFNNTLRVVGSAPVGDESPTNRPGVLLHNQFGWTPHHSHDFVYISSFVGVGRFRSAARGPAAGGPLGQTGILFAAVGLGRYGAALGNVADHAVGGAVGYQRFSPSTRRQLVLEAGARFTYDDEVAKRNEIAAGARYQLAFGRRGVLALDAFGGYDLEASGLLAGGRLEILIKL